jgi:hypothetical protein
MDGSADFPRACSRGLTDCAEDEASTRILRLSRLETTTWTTRQATVPIVNRWHACVRSLAVTQSTVFLRASSLTHGAR